MIPIICPPCAEAADHNTFGGIALSSPVGQGHNPDICRDHEIQPFGCGCQHGRRGETR